MSSDNNPYESNPYAAPLLPVDPIRPQNELQLADLGKRFLGALVDNFFTLPFIVPGFIVMFIGFSQADKDNFQLNAVAVIGIGLIAVGILAVVGIQLYLLYTRSQSVGKYFLKTQIVNFQTGQRANFVSCFLMRSVVNGLIGFVVGLVPVVGGFYGIVDACFVFRSDRRCIHDLIANTVVIDIS